MKPKLFLTFTRLSLCLLASLVSGTAIAQVPVITGIAPSAGPVGGQVTISGTSFNDNPIDDVVRFGAVTAKVLSATKTNLTVSVPAGATYSPVTVTANGKTAYSDAPFLVTFASNDSIDTNSFAPQVTVPTESIPTGVNLIDLDGDGKPDLIVANYGAGTISIFRNISTNGSITPGSFASNVDFAVGSNAYFMAVGDIDGDGKPDLAVANSSSGTVSIFRNLASPGNFTTNSFAAPVDISVAGAGPYQVAIGDLDGDGLPDLVVAHGSAGNSISVLRNLGGTGITSNSFAAQVEFTAGVSPAWVAIGDLDGDGKPDLAVSGDGGTLSILQNTSTPGSISSNSFAAPATWNIGGRLLCNVIGDLDGDGKPDIAVASFAPNFGVIPISPIGPMGPIGGMPTPMPPLTVSSLSILHNVSTGGALTTNSFAPPFNLNTPFGGSQNVQLADMDGDGRLDIVEASAVGLVSIFQNVGVKGALGPSSFAPRLDLPAGANTISLAIGDLDGDGQPDIVAANDYANTLSIFRNTLGPPTAPAIVTQPLSHVAFSGSSVTFSSGASGTAPLAFQWQLDGTNIVSATDSSYTTVASSATAGSYAVTVTNLYGHVTSSTATLAILSASNAPVSGYYAWWNPDTLNGAPGAWTDSSSNAFTLTSAGSAPPVLTTVNGHNALSFNPGGSFNSYLQFPSAFSPNMTNCVLFMVFQPAASLTNHVSHLMLDTEAFGWILDPEYNTDGGSQYQLRPGTVFPQGGPASNGKYEVTPNWQVFAATFNSSNTTLACWTNGTMVYSDGSAICENHTLSGTTFGGTHGAPDFSGYLADIVVYTNQPNIGGLVASNTAYLMAKYGISSGGQSGPPFISSQPQNEILFSGETATFTVGASGTPPLAYQWRFNGTNIVNATNSSYSTEASPAAAGGYAVTVSNNFGHVTSATATLTILNTSSNSLVSGYYAWWNPDSLNGAPGTWTDLSPNSFTLTSSGSPPALTSVNGHNALSLNPGAGLGGGFSSYFSFSSAFQPNMTNCVLFLVLQPAAYLTNHVSHLMLDSSAFGWVLDPEYNNGVASQYQLRPGTVFPQNSPGQYEVVTNWQVFAATFNASNKTLACWTNGTLVYSNGSAICENHVLSGTEFGAWQGVADYSGYLADIIVYTNQPNLGGLVASNTAYLMAKYGITNASSGPPGPPVVSRQPQSQTAFSSEAVTFNVGATGASPLAYQWEFNGGDIAGATNSNYSLTASNTTAGSYEVIVTNAYGSATSSVATLVIVAPGNSAVPGYYAWWNPDSLTSAPGNWIDSGPSAFPLTSAGSAPPTLTTINGHKTLSFNSDGNFNSYLSFSDAFSPNMTNCVLFMVFQPAVSLTNHASHLVLDSEAYGWVLDPEYNIDGASQYQLRPGTVFPQASPKQYEVVPGMQVFVAAFNSSNTTLACWTNGTMVYSDGSALCGNHVLSGTEFGAWQGVADYSGYLADIIVYTNQPNLGGLVASNTAYLMAKYGITNGGGSETTVAIGTAIASPGGVVTVPVNLLALGNENAAAFSVDFDPSVLAFESLAVGTGASNAAMVANASQQTNGRVGIEIALPAGTTFNSGTNQLAQLKFQVVAASASIKTSITFGDQPVARGVSDVLAHSLPANFAGGTVSLSFQWEGDVASRTNGDGALNVFDWVQEGRFVAGLDVVSNANEFQRADCAPLDTLGDGIINAADWVQVGRFAAGLDPLTLIGGPTGPVPGGQVPAGRPEDQLTRTVSLVPLAQAVGGSSVAVQLSALGSENALTFSVAFDPAAVAFTGATVGGGAPDAIFNVNTNLAASGQIGVALALPPGSSFDVGNQQMAVLNFASSSYSNRVALAFGNSPIAQGLADITATSLPTDFQGVTLAVGGSQWPQLNASPSQNGLVMSWPAAATGFNVETASTINGPWTVVPGTAVASGGPLTLVIPTPAGTAYYRLHHQ